MLGIVHESGGLGEVDGKAFSLVHDAAGSAGHLGDLVGAKALNDLIKRAGDWRQRGELFNQWNLRDLCENIEQQFLYRAANLDDGLES